MKKEQKVVAEQKQIKAEIKALYKKDQKLAKKVASTLGYRIVKAEHGSFVELGAALEQLQDRYPQLFGSSRDVQDLEEKLGYDSKQYDAFAAALEQIHSLIGEALDL